MDFIRPLCVDIALIGISDMSGISGIEADGRLFDFDYREVKVTRAIIENAREVWLADPSNALPGRQRLESKQAARSAAKRRTRA